MFCKFVYYNWTGTRLNINATTTNDKKFQNIDAFVCTFPASMCQLWMAFEKPFYLLVALFINPRRFDKKTLRIYNIKG